MIRALADSNTRAMLIPTALGIGLFVAGFALILSPIVSVLIFGGTALGLGSVIAALVRRKRPDIGTDRTQAQEVSDWQDFVKSRRRWAPWESLFCVYIVGVLIYIEGLTLGTILIIAGFGVLLAKTWFIEPRTLAEITHRKAAPSLDPPPNGVRGGL